MTRLEARARRLRFAVDCDTTEQVLDLLALTKALGLSPKLGATGAEDEPARLNGHARRKYTRKAKEEASQREKPGKPKRYPQTLLVRVADTLPAGVPPKVAEVFKALRTEFGTDAFQKRIAKGVVIRRTKIKSPTSHITKLMDVGGLVPAEAKPST